MSFQKTSQKKKRGFITQRRTQEITIRIVLSLRHLITIEDGDKKMRQHYLASNANLNPSKSLKLMPQIFRFVKIFPRFPTKFFVTLRPTQKNCKTIELRDLMILTGNKKQDIAYVGIA